MFEGFFFLPLSCFFFFSAWILHANKVLVRTPVCVSQCVFSCKYSPCSGTMTRILPDAALYHSHTNTHSYHCDLIEATYLNRGLVTYHQQVPGVLMLARLCFLVRFLCFTISRRRLNIIHSAVNSTLLDEKKKV